MGFLHIKPLAQFVDFRGGERGETSRAGANLIEKILLIGFEAVEKTIDLGRAVALPESKCRQHRGQFAFVEHGDSFMGLQNRNESVHSKTTVLVLSHKSSLTWTTGI